MSFYFYSQARAEVNLFNHFSYIFGGGRHVLKQHMGG
jgi:hypothetical protein